MSSSNIYSENKTQKCNRQIRGLDVFGYPIGIQYKNKSEHTTPFGGVTTVILALFCFIYAGLTFSYFYGETLNSFQSQIMYQPNHSAYFNPTINQDRGGFNMAVGFVGVEMPLAIGSIVMTQEKETSFNGQINSHKKLPLKTRRCGKEPQHWQLNNLETDTTKNQI